jgi:hypothetical protein
MCSLGYYARPMIAVFGGSHTEDTSFMKLVSRNNFIQILYLPDLHKEKLIVVTLVKKTCFS